MENRRGLEEFCPSARKRREVTDAEQEVPTFLLINAGSAGRRCQVEVRRRCERWLA